MKPKIITSRIVVVAVLLAFGIGVVQGEDSLNISMVSSMFDNWENGTDLQIDDNYLYVTMFWSGMRILDVSEPDNPIEVGRFFEKKTISYATVDNGIAYVLVDSAHLRVLEILDVSDPAEPTPISQIIFDYQFGRFTVQNGLLYVSSLYIRRGLPVPVYEYGLRIWDVSNPERPQFLSYFQTLHSIAEFEVHDGFAYCATPVEGQLDQRYMIIIDVRDPRDPQIASTLENIGNLAHIRFVNGYIYTTDPDDRLRIFDISDPANPQQVGEFDRINHIRDMVVIGDFLYIAKGLYQDQGWTPGIVVLDITNPESPEWGRIYLTSDFTDVNSLATKDGYLFTLSYNYTTLRCYDSANPIDINLIYERTNYGHIVDVDTYGEIAYLTIGGWDVGIGIVDIVDSEHPQFLEYQYLMQRGPAEKSIISNNYLFTSGGGGNNGKWSICDLTRPEHPEQIYVGELGDISDFAIQGNYAYLAVLWEGLLTFDITNPSAPRQVDLLEARHNFTKIRVLGDRAIVYDNVDDGHFCVLSLSIPAHPRRLATFDPEEDIYYDDFDSDERLFFYGKSELKIRDLENLAPRHPVTINLADTGECTFLKQLNSEYIVRGLRKTGLTIHLLEGRYPNLNQATLIGQYDYIYSDVQGMDFCFPYLYVADNRSFRIFDIGTAVAHLNTVEDQTAPSTFSLSAPFPNPFNSSTTISFSVYGQSPHAIAGGVGGVRLAIYDLSGRLVSDLLGSAGVSAGTHKVVWEAGEVPAGVYLVRLESGNQTRTQKLVLMR